MGLACETNRNLAIEMARYEANADFQRDYYKRRELAGRSLGNNDEVNIIYKTLNVKGCRDGMPKSMQTRWE